MKKQHRRVPTKELVEGAPLAPGILLQSLSIIDVSLHHDLTTSFTEKKKKFAVYTIRVHSFQSVGPKKVNHRFSSFRELHRKLLQLKTTHYYLLKGLKFPSKFTFGPSTSNRVVKKRTKKLEIYLRTILQRVTKTREEARRDPACALLREFLLLRAISGSGRRGAAPDPMLKVRVASEAFSAQNATLRVSLWLWCCGLWFVVCGLWFVVVSMLSCCCCSLYCCWTVISRKISSSLLFLLFFFSSFLLLVTSFFFLLRSMVLE